MAATDITCPFCNSTVRLLTEAPPGPTVTCPRCEQSFKLQGPATRQNGGPVSSPSLPPPPAPRRFSNRSLALIVVGVMALMAAAATTLALATKDERRANDTGLKRQRSLKRPRQRDLPDHVRIDPVPPLEMSALKLLPADVDVLAGVHVASVLQVEEGERLLEREVPGLGGSVQTKLLNRLGEITGLEPEQLDHVVLGARVRDVTLTVAVRTRIGYDPARIIKRLRADVLRKTGDQTIYKFRQELLSREGNGLLRFEKDGRSLVLAWGVDAEEFAKPRADDGLPRPELVSLLKERVKPIGPVWLAGHVEAKYSQTLSGLLALSKVPEAERAVLGDLRSFAVWLTLEEPITVRGVARSTAENTAETALKYLMQRLGEGKGVKLFREKEWVLMQYRPEE